jgi:tetratricopeptide (TPR) repeat protein
MDAVGSLDTNSSVDERILLYKNLALVYKSRNNFTKMIEILEPWQQTAMPYDQEYWLNLALAYQKTDQREKSFQAILNGLVLDSNEELLSLAKNQGYTDAEINTAAEKFKRELIAFSPGHRVNEQTTSARVTLAELFTGAECGPCVGADKALDVMAEYYSRQNMVLIEYHLHIPGPDPLTNVFSETRYGFYGQNFGTPTVFINGLGVLTGGGPDVVKKSLFFRYRQEIQKYENSPQRFALDIATEQQQQQVNVKVEVSSLGYEEVPRLNLYLALLEKSVNYIGANRISPHAFVVRYMANQDAGLGPVVFSEGKSLIEHKIDLREVNAGLKKYLDDFTQNPPERFKNFPGWNVRPEQLDPHDLAVVAWIQAEESREVYQAGYAELKID